MSGGNQGAFWQHAVSFATCAQASVCIVPHFSEALPEVFLSQSVQGAIRNHEWTVPDASSEEAPALVLRPFSIRWQQHQAVR